MNQSNLIFASLFVAFVVFITMRGELPSYLSALIGTNAAPKATGSGAQASAGGGGIGGAVAGAAGGAVQSAVSSFLGK